MIGWVLSAAVAAEPQVEAWVPREPTAPAATVEPFTVAPLVVRVDEKLVGVTGEQLRVYLIEQIRALSWPVLGMENVLFAQDHSADARFVLGGEIRDVYAATREGRAGTAVDVRWQVLDTRSDAVVYEVVTRGWLATVSGVAHGDELLMVAAKNLLARQGFSRALTAVVSGPVDQGPLTVSRCASEPVELPAAFDRVLPATVAVRAGRGSGSGVMVSPDGFALTAAHVVAGESDVGVLLHHGPELRADVVRIDVERDVAVLKVAGSGFACLSPTFTAPAPGEAVYLVGAPLATSFQSSISSGVVSGLRTIDGAALLQTDAAASPGSSGGPLLDRHGALLGIMSEKIAGRAVEGMSFAVPVETAFTAFGLTLGDRSDAVAAVATAAPVVVVPDAAEPPIVPRDARICVFWKGSTGLPQALELAGATFELAPRQYACIAVPSGPHRLMRQGIDATYFGSVGETTYVQLLGRTGTTLSDQAAFDRAMTKPLTEVKVELPGG